MDSNFLTAAFGVLGIAGIGYAWTVNGVTRAAGGNAVTPNVNVNVETPLQPDRPDVSAVVADVLTPASQRRFFSDEHLRNVQRMLTYKFWCYRKGVPWDQAGTEATWSRLRVPARSGEWQGRDPEDRGKGKREVEPLVPLRMYATVPKADTINTNSGRRARKAISRLALRLGRHHLNFNRMLGWGGHGAAALFDRRGGGGGDGDGDGDVEFVVVKCMLDPERAAKLNGEQAVHSLLSRALHTVQSYEIRQLAVPGRGVAGPSQTQASGVRFRGASNAPAMRSLFVPSTSRMASDDCIILEHCKRGDLMTILIKMAKETPPRRFTNRMLWHIFECLFKAVVAMEYPPILRQTLGPDMVSETVPRPESSVNGSNLIHLDIDPQNVLVGDFNVGPAPDHHAVLPILKIGDFGLVHFFGDAQRRNVELAWDCRNLAKPGYYTPEQFHQEWDHHDGAPAASAKRHTIAGNYTWKTNLYQTALVMFSCITLAMPPDKPVARPIRLTRADKTKRIAWSYGADLLETKWDPIDRQLRILVTRCLLEEPGDRPSMWELETVIQAKVRGPWGDEASDDRTESLARSIMGDPPPPQLVSTIALNAWRAGSDSAALPRAR